MRIPPVCHDDYIGLSNFKSQKDRPGLIRKLVVRNTDYRYKSVEALIKISKNSYSNNNKEINGDT